MHSICDGVSGGQCDRRCGPSYLTQAGSWPCVPGALGKLDYGETQGDRDDHLCRKSQLWIEKITFVQLCCMVASFPGLPHFLPLIRFRVLY